MGKRVLIVAAYFLAGLPTALLAQDKLDAAALAARIDQRLSEKWQEVVPAPTADDAEYFRRVYLDVAGRIPRVSEIADFLGNSATDRREQVVEQLLETPQYVN